VAQKLVDSLRMIQGECRRLTQLVADLLRFARDGSGSLELELTPLTEVARQVVDRLSSCIEHTNARIDIAELPSVAVDRRRVGLLLQNLIENGLKYQTAGATPEIRITGEREQGGVRVWVHDNGIGIAPEHQTAIFEAFRRLHGDEIAGSGLGLAHCARIIRDHGGTIGVDSAVGAGSSFWFTIPTET